jgi:hypothetical protein
MLCQTVKSGLECSFMSKKGCGFFGGSCHTIIEKCGDCSKIMEYSSGKYCKVYPDPTSKWLNGSCPTATHIKLEVAENAQKINPLKASKRANKKS